MDATQIKFKALEEQILGDLSKIEMLEREKKNLTARLIDQDDEIKALKQKAIDEGRRADVLKVENLRQRDIMLEMAREKIDAGNKRKRKWHDFWKGQK